MDVVGKVRSKNILHENINYLFLGVTSTALNGFSQAASSQLPMGTWENGVFDYDHLKRSYIPSYTRYWDDQSKVPFLFNPSTGIWITYDDLQSIGIKNNYIKQKRLGGAFFWELSSDRQAELVGATFNALTNGLPPSTSQPQSSTSPPQITTTTATPRTSSTSRGTPPPSTSTSSTTKSSTPGNISEWKPYTAYSVGQKVTYQGLTYSCRQAHTSLPDWMPPVVPALWLQV